jgi:myo-inositol-1(or 4)-monophosphatase
MAESEDKMKTMAASFSWKLRKQATIDHLKGIDREAKVICLGDKLANLREIARDYRQQGDTLWSRFNQKDKNEHAWYYRSVFEILAEAFKGESAIAEYRALLKEVFES